MVNGQRIQHISQSDWESVELRTQSALNLRPLLFQWEPVVAGNHLVEPLGILTADVSQVTGQLIRQRIPIALRRFKPPIIHLPILLQYLRKRNPVIIRWVCLMSDLAVMGLGIKQGQEVTIRIEGEDEAAAAEAIEKFFKENL